MSKGGYDKLKREKMAVNAGLATVLIAGVTALVKVGDIIVKVGKNQDCYREIDELGKGLGRIFNKEKIEEIKKEIK